MRIRQLVVAWIVTLAIRASITLAGGDTALTYQGRLLDAGEPASGQFDLEFSLWDAVNGGNPVGVPQVLNNTPVADGLFTVQLDFGANAFDNNDRWLAISVDGVPLTPRQSITRAPYSIQTRGIYVDQDQSVFVGRDTPITSSEVFGIHRETELFGGMYISTSSQLGLPFYGYAAGGDVDAYHYYEGSTGKWHLLNGNAHRLTVQSNGNVGIGTITPNANLQVVGDGSGTVLHLTNGSGGGGTALVAGDVFGSGKAAVFYGNTSSDLLSVQNDGSGNAASFIGNVEVVNDDGDTITALNTAPGGLRYALRGESVSDSGRAVYGYASSNQGTNIGLYGRTSSPNGYGVWSQGNCNVNGTLSKSGGSFRIDHPLDPENKYLQHSFVESPDMMNVYNGNVILDENGKALVDLPDYFNELNRDFRYQLTPMGASMPNLHISQEIANNSFGIAGGKARMKVSWQVTGIRQDPWAENHRIEVEPYKRPEHQGKYLNPELYGQPKEMAVHYFPDAERAVTEPALAKAQAEPISNPLTGEKK